jgi:hypothetical protein
MAECWWQVETEKVLAYLGKNCLRLTNR